MNMDKKELYTIPKMELITVEYEDVIKTSAGNDETPFVPFAF